MKYASPFPYTAGKEGNTVSWTLNDTVDDSIQGYRVALERHRVLHLSTFSAC